MMRLNHNCRDLLVKCSSAQVRIKVMKAEHDRQVASKSWITEQKSVAVRKKFNIPCVCYLATVDCYHRKQKYHSTKHLAAKLFQDRIRINANKRNMTAESCDVCFASTRRRWMRRVAATKYLSMMPTWRLSRRLCGSVVLAFKNVIMEVGSRTLRSSFNHRSDDKQGMS